MERAVHDEYYEHFYTEYHAAYMEHSRLLNLFREMCWYHFEIQCSKWKHPWPQSNPESLIVLCSVRREQIQRRGRCAEKVTYPVYYAEHLNGEPPAPTE